MKPSENRKSSSCDINTYVICKTQIYTYKFISILQRVSIFSSLRQVPNKTDKKSYRG